MALYHSPQISMQGLVSCLDARNSKCFPDTTPINEHGYAEWYCFVTGVATYSIVNSGVSIVEKQPNGTITTVVSTSSGPIRGFINVIEGRTYYGVGGPINLVVEDQHHYIAPLTMVGTQFIWWAFRGTPGTTYLYSPYKNTTIKFWDNPASGGITSTSPTSIFTLNAGISTSFSFTTPVNVEATEVFYLTSTEPVLATTTQTGSDKTILSPASKYVYQRVLSLDSTVIQTSAQSRQTGCVYDPTNSVMSETIADGSGGDCAQGLGLEYLSDTYSWGNVLSDYTLSCPYSGIITTSYWSGSNWIVWDTHTITGTTLTNPTVIYRDGTNGPGVSASSISGISSNMASGANIWKWEGNVPFYLCINDNADDEFSVLGWMSSRVGIKNTNQYLNDIIGQNKVTVHGSLIYNSSGYYSFPNNQITNYLMQTSFPMPTGDHTISCWFRSNFFSLNQTPYTYSANGDNTYLLYTDSSTIIVPHSFGDRFAITVPNMQNRWCNFVRTRIRTTGEEIYYMDGIQIGSRIINAGISAASNGDLIIGQEPDSSPTSSSNGSFDIGQNLDGDFARLDVYNRALSPQEVQQNYNALKGRFQ